MLLATSDIGTIGVLDSECRGRIVGRPVTSRRNPALAPNLLATLLRGGSIEADRTLAGPDPIRRTGSMC